MSRRMRWIVALLMAGMMTAACGRKENAGPKEAAAPLSGRAANIAKAISADAGKVKAAADGTSGRTVIVFEETHTSKLGQLEIAQMLVRLHDGHGLRRVSLEGAIFDDGVLPAAWFHAAKSEAAVDARQEAAVRLLQEGEINAAEFVALVLPDVQVRGNEEASEYAVHLSDAASSASGQYLLGIAQQSLTQDQIIKANELIQADKQKEALDFIMQSDPWVRERFEKLTNKRGIVSAEEMTTIIREIDDKATQVNAEMSSEAKAGLSEAIHFFETASKRSDTMIDRTLVIAGETPDAPVAILIGAAHTQRVVELLQKSGASYAVISPNAIGVDSPGQMTMADYERKNARQSVDRTGMLGAYLDGRRKPPPCLSQQWCQSKSEIYLATVLLTREAAAGQPPPFDKIAGDLAELRSISIDPTSYEILEDDDRKRVIFKVTARIDDREPARTVDIWVGGWDNEPPRPPTPGKTAVPSSQGPRRRLEDMLKDAREELAREQAPPAAAGDVVLLEISKRTRAMYSTSQTALKEGMRSAV